MFSIASASRVPVPSGQAMVIARSDERADQAAWVTRLRRAHPARCESIGGPIGVGSYFDPETITTQGRGFLEGVLQELSSKNGQEAKPAVVATAAMMPATPPFSATASPAASPAGNRISVEDLFAAADKAGGFLGLSRSPHGAVAVAVGTSAIPPPTPLPSANPAALRAGRHISVEDLFASVNKAGGFLGTSRSPPVVVAAAVASFATPPPPTSPSSTAPPASRRLSVKELLADPDKVGCFMGLWGPPPAVAVGSAGLAPARPPVSRWASIWAQAAPAGSTPIDAVAAPVADAAAFAALGAAPPTPPATPPRSPTPPATRKKTSTTTNTKTPPAPVNRP
ncbi:MAG: hypothetical protein M1826_002833 [Phylliscum demangeonii]|nr:MAG: hypothetical protein M1826_002833 [Phylliscum demangeonii]